MPSDLARTEIIVTESPFAPRRQAAATSNGVKRPASDLESAAGATWVMNEELFRAAEENAASILLPE
jgi:hypothetical protein